MTLGKRYTTEYFSDLLDDWKRSFSTGKSHERRNLTLLQKSVSEAAARRSEVYPRLP